MIPRLEWGLSGAVPDDAVSAWGARAIVTQDGYVDFVADRQDCQGTGAVVDRLNEEFPMEKFWDSLGELLRSYRMNTRRAELFELFKPDTLTVVANTNASAGYCYIAAWTTGPKGG